ncbi:Uncharacterized protein APZ42_014471 [Daphnia magna]|uniref:Uncharacterized protein n=1 Tax=Daphnia magna TaxID=35525 RepID=A0A162PVA6_9CRUS|nr:Uncharacterized protein APZ42_014471 [Daphnia magna]
MPIMVQLTVAAWWSTDYGTRLICPGNSTVYHLNLCQVTHPKWLCSGFWKQESAYVNGVHPKMTLCICEGIEHFTTGVLRRCSTIKP